MTAIGLAGPRAPTPGPALAVMAARAAMAAIAAGAALAPTPTAALAEVGGPGDPTVQARAADATWLAYTPPPLEPGIVCMVDSGVDPNPDTEAAVIGGQAIAPETGTNDEIARLDARVQPGNHPDGHGTVMAMIMAAPRNGWGMVGLAPTSVRVYNMKALPRGAVTFPFGYYAVAIEDCAQLAALTHRGMTVVNLSLGGASRPGGAELALFEHYVALAHETGLDVVAAAGNEGGPVLYSAAYPPVLAVGAGDVAGPPGARCPFGSHGEGLDLIAPGCDTLTGGLEVAFEDDGSPALGSGSSQASALVAATLASMRAYDPLLTWSQAEDCLTETATNGALDVKAAFEACGLEAIVSAGEAAERAAAPAESTPATTATGATESEPTPRTPSATRTALRPFEQRPKRKARRCTSRRRRTSVQDRARALRPVSRNRRCTAGSARPCHPPGVRRHRRHACLAHRRARRHVQSRSVHRGRRVRQPLVGSLRQ